MTSKPTSAAAVLAGAILCGLLAAAATAAPAPVDRNPSRVVDAAALRPTTEDETGKCSRTRKRLWVESEGWVVRRVTICH